MQEHLLYAVPTWGSAIVELCFNHSDLKYRTQYLRAADVHGPEYLKINPLGQIPTLILPNGEKMTGSLAICTYINEVGHAGLAPTPDDADYVRYLRWSVFMVDSLYSSAAYYDHPDWYVSDAKARQELRDAVMKQTKERFLMVENETRSPWFLGEQKSLIDLYLGVMTFWEPGHEWFQKNCPKMMANVERLQQTSEFKKVYHNNSPASRP